MSPFNPVWVVVTLADCSCLQNIEKYKNMLVSLFLLNGIALAGTFNLFPIPQAVMDVKPVTKLNKTRVPLQLNRSLKNRFIKFRQYVQNIIRYNHHLNITYSQRTKTRLLTNYLSQHRLQRYEIGVYITSRRITFKMLLVVAE